MNILIVEDNKVISENIALYLRNRGYTVEVCSDGERAFEEILHHPYDLLILDRMLPRIDGLSLVRMLRARSISVPFLFLTALSKQVDKIEGLSLGADDYLVKPFDLEELALRVENILKRHGKELRRTGVLTAHGVVVDTLARRVYDEGVPIELSPKEYELLELLMREQGNILDRDRIYEKVW